jgi:glyoxylase-like metal-dependent hydrolase (beta-lactamase superfamily II)
VHVTELWLSPEVPLRVHLVTGTRYAVLVDTGVAQMYGQITEMISRSLPRPSDLKVIVNTHAHHDHIGCNAGVAEFTGALVAATSTFAHWHTDMDRHYAEFALQHPDILPDDPKSRHDLMATIDAPHPVDLLIDEGFVLDLGGGVALEAFAVPGHMGGELGFLERSTRTLILGDSLIGTDWSFFHGYYDVDVYLRSLHKIRRIVEDTPVQWVRAAHHAPLAHADALEAIDHVIGTVGLIDDAVRHFAKVRGQFTLEDVWRAVSEEFVKTPDFRGLRTVEAHVTALASQGALDRRQSDTFGWSGGP